MIKSSSSHLLSTNRSGMVSQRPVLNGGTGHTKEIRFDDLVVDPFPPGFRRVGGVEDGDFVFFVFEPFEHVSHGGFGGRLSSLFALGVVYIEELGVGMRVVCPSVLADIEDFGFDGRPP